MRPSCMAGSLRRSTRRSRAWACSIRVRSPAISPAPKSSSAHPVGWRETSWRGARARGEYGDMVRASAPPRRLRVRRSWDDAIGSREQLVFALRVVVDEISATLARDGFAALRLELRLDREDAGPLRIERTVLPPTREAAALLRSLRWALEERSELGLVTGCALEVPEVEPARGRQIGLFAPDGARAEEAIATARYLRAKLGTGAVLRARVADEAARLPERATEWVEVIA